MLEIWSAMAPTIIEPYVLWLVFSLPEPPATAVVFSSELSSVRRKMASNSLAALSDLGSTCSAA